MSGNDNMKQQPSNERTSLFTSVNLEEKIAPVESDGISTQENDWDGLSMGCSFCGGALSFDPAGDYVKISCDFCGHDHGIKKIDDKFSKWLFSKYEGAILAATSKSNWAENEKEIETSFFNLQKFLGDYKNDPYFAMLNVARLTHGFKPSWYRKLLKGKIANNEADRLFQPFFVRCGFE